MGKKEVLKNKKGIHIIAGFFGCSSNQELLLQKRKLESRIGGFISYRGLTILDKSFFKFRKGGVTGIFLLAESHLAIHTWPERDNYFSLDIFVCNYQKDNSLTAKKILLDIEELFKPRAINKRIIKRQ